MGKNQQHKAMQKGRGEEGDPTETLEEGGVDVSFHSAEWHAARYEQISSGTGNNVQKTGPCCNTNQ